MKVVSSFCLRPRQVVAWAFSESRSDHIWLYLKGGARIGPTQSASKDVLLHFDVDPEWQYRKLSSSVWRKRYDPCHEEGILGELRSTLRL